MKVSGPWVCDWCGEAIRQASDGMLQWQTKSVDDRAVSQDPRIVHFLTASPRGGKNGCYLGRTPSTALTLRICILIKSRGRTVWSNCCRC